MGWMWQNDVSPRRSSRGFRDENPNPISAEDGCSTSKIVRSQCHTEEVEPGKFVRKCEKSEEILRTCIGRPTEVVKSCSEYTEEDITNEMTKRGKPSLPFNSPDDDDDDLFTFPGLRSDIEAIEKNLVSSLGHFIQAAEEISNGLSKIFGAPRIDEDESVSPSGHGIVIEDPSEDKLRPSPSRHSIQIEGPSDA